MISKYRRGINSFIQTKEIPTYVVVAASAWISRLFCAGMQIFMIPLIVGLIGMDGYECFVLMGSVASWYLLFDLGMGASLQNYISESKVSGKECIPYIYFVGIFIMGILCLSVVFIYFTSPYLADAVLRKYTFLAVQEKQVIFFCTSIIALMNMVSTIMLKIWYGEQKGYLSNIIPAIGMAISLIFILSFSYCQITIDLLMLLLIWMAPSAGIPFVIFLKRIYKIFKIQGHVVDKKIAENVIARGARFWVFAIVGSLTLQIDYIIMSQFVQGNGIVAYNITSKMYILVLFAYTAIISALWPVFTEELIKNNWTIVIQYFKKYVLLGLVLFVVTIGLNIQYMPTIIQLFLRTDSIVVANSFIILMGIYYIIRVWTDFFSMILQSMSDMNMFIIAVPIQACISVTFQYILVQNYQIYGIVFGLIISFICTTVWCLPYRVWKIYHMRKHGGDFEAN